MRCDQQITLTQNLLRIVFAEKDVIMRLYAFNDQRRAGRFISIVANALDAYLAWHIAPLQLFPTWPSRLVFFFDPPWRPPNQIPLTTTTTRLRTGDMYL